MWEETRQIGRRPVRRLTPGRGTRRQVERFVVDPNEIKTLRTGEAVVITKPPDARPVASRRPPERGVER